MDYVIEPTAGLAAVASIYRQVGFRRDLVDDLAFVQRLGGVVFTAQRDGTVVGVSSCLPFGTTGWVGGVAVLPDHGRRGLGERLTRTAADAIRDRGIATVLLHATPMAAPLYARMGFTHELDLVELKGALLPDVPSATRPGTAADLDTVLRLDHEATGEDRGVLIRALWPHGGRLHDHGFSLRQSPTGAGAVIATTAEAGEALLTAALSGRESDKLRVALPADQEHARKRLADLGFRESTRTSRMRLGPPVPIRPDRVYSVFNLYWG